MKEIRHSLKLDKQTVIHDLNGSLANIRSSLQNLWTDPLIAETLLKETASTISNLLQKIGKNGNEKK